MTSPGYGKILDVNLITREINISEIPREFAMKYVGGMGFTNKVLYDEVGTSVDPLSPDNMLLFANGPLTGTHALSSARTEITTKSPLTGNIGTGNTGGLWGTKLKHAGFDMIIIRGKSEKPVYLWIDDEIVEIKEASHLWGKNTVEASDILVAELGSGVSVLAIGQAGENLVKFACPLNDYHHVAARCGAGTVMGDKRLKAIAVRGTRSVHIARPEKFKEAINETRDRLTTARKLVGFGGSGGGAWDVKHGSLPGKNYQTGFFPNWMETHDRATAAKYTKGVAGPCWACPNQCFRITEVNDGKYAGLSVTRASALGVQYAFSAKCAIENVQAVWKCKELCQQLGMDYVSAAGVIAFAMELFQRGIITTSDTDGLELSWGNEDASIQLLKNIAFREGFGDILAEGSVQAAAKLGNDAKKYVMTVKGMEMMATDPRAGKKGYAFGVIANPRGADNVKTTHNLAEEYNPNWWVEQFDMFEEAKKAMYGMPPEQVPHTWEGKAMMVKWFGDLYSVLNAMGVCFFPAGFTLAWGPTHLSRLLTACTGWDTTPEDIMNYGERMFNLMKAYAVRQGQTRKDDNWPDRFYEESLPDGPAKGARLSRTEVEQLLDEYYELRGWDKRTGVPTREKLMELGLEDIVKDLDTIGKLP